MPPKLFPGLFAAVALSIPGLFVAAYLVDKNIRAKPFPELFETLGRVAATIEHRAKVKNKINVGDLLVLHFSGDGVRVTARATVTWACPTNNDSCEVTRYRAKISVASGDASTSLDAEGEYGS